MLRIIIKRAQLTQTLSAVVKGVEFLTSERPPWRCQAFLEVDLIKRATIAGPMVRAATQTSDAVNDEGSEGLSCRLAFIKVLGLPLRFEPAAFQHDDATTFAGKITRKCDSGGAPADNANVSSNHSILR